MKNKRFIPDAPLIRVFSPHLLQGLNRFSYFYGMYFRTSLVLLLFVCSFKSLSQTRGLDSIRLLLQNAKDDRSRLLQLKKIASHHQWISNLDSAIYYGDRAALIALKLNERTELCDIYGNLGLAYSDKGKHPKALEYYLKSLRLAEEIGDNMRAADNYVRMGAVFDEQSDYDKAIKNYYTGLSVYQKAGRKDRIALTLGNIGNIYYSKKQFDKALEFYLKGLTIDKELNNVNNLRYSLGYVAMACAELSKRNPAKKDSLSREAKKYYLQALELSAKWHDMHLVINWLGNLGITEIEMGELKNAEKTLLRTVMLADSMGLPQEKMEFENALSELYYLMKDFKRSIDHYKIYTKEKDSLFNAEKNREITKQEMNYEFEKKMSKVRSDQEKKEAATEARARQHKLIIISVMVGLLITFLALLIILRSLRTTRLQKTIIEKQKHLVDQKQKEIIDSIHYAKRIQQSLLATETYIQKSMKRLLKH